MKKAALTELEERLYYACDNQFLSLSGFYTFTPTMSNAADNGQPIHYVTSFNDLVATPFHGSTNAVCWTRQLTGNFAELVEKLELTENITLIDAQTLLALELSKEGNLARAIILEDLQRLQDYGADPALNLIRCYDRDDSLPFFPTDVYSFHADRSAIPNDTYLCTYYGAASELLPAAEVRQKITIPEIRNALKKLYQGPDEGFDAFLTEHFFDLHYEATGNAQPVSLGIGHIWKLATDHPESPVPPCIHRAPRENGQLRLLLIC